MGMEQLNVNGVTVDKKTKEELIEIMDGMLEDSTNRLKKLKTYANKRKEKVNISFFGSINHYLKGDN